MRRLLFISLILATFNTQAATAAGRVENIHCLSKAYQLIRNGAKLDVSMWLALETGDIIDLDSKVVITDPDEQSLNPKALPYQIKSKDFALKKTDCLQLYRVVSKNNEPVALEVNSEAMILSIKGNDEKILTLKIKDFPYTVKQTGHPATVRSNLLDWGMKNLTFWRENQLKAGLRQLNTRSENQKTTLASPMFSLDSKSQLISGERALFIGWSGGTAPYNLKINISGNEEPLFTAEKLENPSVTTPVLQWKDGIYQIMITSIKNAEKPVKFFFKVVTEHPIYPAELSSLPLEVSATLKALCLAAYPSVDNKKHWLFEAYQQVADIAEKYPAAATVRDAILNNYPIESPCPTIIFK